MPEMSPGLKKAIHWLSESVQEHTGKSRDAILSEAQLRFDLSPRECEFLNRNFCDLVESPPH